MKEAHAIGQGGSGVSSDETAPLSVVESRALKGTYDQVKLLL